MLNFFGVRIDCSHVQWPETSCTLSYILHGFKPIFFACSGTKRMWQTLVSHISQKCLEASISMNTWTRRSTKFNLTICSITTVHRSKPYTSGSKGHFALKRLIWLKVISEQPDAIVTDGTQIKRTDDKLSFSCVSYFV